MNQTAAKTLWLALLVIILDQITKIWAVSVLAEGETYTFIPYLDFTLVYNYGAAFSFLSDMGGWQRWFFTAIAVVVSTVLIVWLRKLPKTWSFEVIGLNLILGGAIGNVIDRIYQGKVTDFIDFYVGTWHFATFNIADIGVSLGAAMLIWFEFFIRPKQEKAQQEAQGLPAANKAEQSKASSSPES